MLSMSWEEVLCAWGSEEFFCSCFKSISTLFFRYKIAMLSWCVVWEKGFEFF
jgi:hypothetical protein